MKTTLMTVALFASQLCVAQRFFETTTGSWNHQNLSVETKTNYVVSGFTETNPATGRLTPTFKVNNPGGGAGPAFYLNYPDNVYLMDFTLRQPTNTLVFVGMVAATSTGAPYKMLVGEWNYTTGALVQSYLMNAPDNTIPHQVVVSESVGQVAIVGTRVSGIMSTTNFNILPKSGFYIGLNLANFAVVNFNQQMDTPLTGSTDNDMLETLTEVPGTGYFLSGSANGPANEQNLYNMGINYGGAMTHSRILDNTNFRGAGASVMYSPTAGRVFLLANSSVIHQFQVAMCDPVTGALMTPLVSHQITTMPIGSGVDQNGFRLIQNAAGQLVVAGYLSAPAGALPQLLTPFQMTLTTGLAYVNGRHYLSGNNAPLTGYFEERGNSVYINTPDIIAFNPTANRTYVVSQNNVNGGFDLDVSLPAVNGCERPLTTTAFSNTPVLVGSAAPAVLPISPAPYIPTPSGRAVAQTVLCQQAAVATQPVVYPNPANEQIRITLEEDEQISSVSIYDLKGNRVAEEAAGERTRSEFTLDVSKLTSGVYVISITDAGGVVHHTKFVRE